MGPQHQYSGEDKQAALAYAQAARKKGFDWVKDPDADTPTSITIPGTVSESELRRFLKECPTDGANISYALLAPPRNSAMTTTKSSPNSPPAARPPKPRPSNETAIR